MNIDFPEHIGLIMDGNGRWAKKRLLPKKLGHKAGADALNKLIKCLEKTNVKHVTVYAFSTENWNRPKDEVNELMKLLKTNIKEYIKKSRDTNIKVDIIGDISILNEDLKEKIRELKEISKSKTGLNLHIALNYGGRDEIINAIKKISEKVKNGHLDLKDINQEIVKENLYTYNYPDPDLIIRTSGEIRMSNFLLWQSAYSELYFCDKLWPDFTFEDLKIAVKSFNNRERRFGARNKEI